MDSEERVSVVERLHTSRDVFLDAVAGLSEAQATYRPGPHSWSIDQIAEHVAVEEQKMLRLISAQYEVLGEPASADGEALWTERALDRNLTFECPEGSRPTGRFGSFLEAILSFTASREETIRFISEGQDDLRMRAVTHPYAGEISGQECLMILIAHPMRHAEQVRDIKSSPGFRAV
jgi:uncharacterized damage-inducible protein DinB